MAYLMHHFWPGGTIEQYQVMRETIHPAGGLPEGQTYHAAGVTDEGVVITAVWDSKESADRFVSDVLIAAMPIEGGFEGQPVEQAAEIVNIETA